MDIARWIPDQLRDDGEYGLASPEGRRSDHTRSSATAMPWPTPMHMVESE